MWSCSWTLNLWNSLEIMSYSLPTWPKKNLPASKMPMVTSGTRECLNGCCLALEKMTRVATSSSSPQGCGTTWSTSCAPKIQAKVLWPGDWIDYPGTPCCKVYGLHMARMLCGFLSIEDTWLTRKSLKHASLQLLAVESLLKDSYIDMYQCMHFLDNWEEDKSGETDWEDIFAVEKYEPSPDVWTHRGWLQSVMEGGCQLWQMVDYR